MIRSTMGVSQKNMRVAVTLGVLLAVLGACTGLRRVVYQELRDAHAFVLDGNREVAKGNRASAALAFDRARWIAPRADFVRTAADAAEIPSFDPLVPRAIGAITGREWSAIATMFGWILGLGVLLLVAREKRVHAGTLALAGGLAFAAAMTAMVRSNAAAPAVVIEADAPMLVSPYASASIEEKLPVGTAVIPGDSYESYIHVRSSDGREGWLLRSTIERVAGAEG